MAGNVTAPAAGAPQAVERLRLVIRAVCDKTRGECEQRYVEMHVCAARASNMHLHIPSCAEAARLLAHMHIVYIYNI